MTLGQGNRHKSYGPDEIRARAAGFLVAGALAMALLATGSIWVQRGLTGQKIVAGKVLPDFTADMPQVRTITIETGDSTYNLVRTGTGWAMPERNNYSVAPASLASLAKGLSDLSYKVARTTDTSQFARLGVDDPGAGTNSVLLSLKSASGQLLDSLHIGQKSDALFVRKAGSNEVFEASGALPAFSNLANWLDLKVVDIAPETIASVSGQRAGQARYDIVRRPDGGFAPVGGVVNVTATTAAIALTKWAPSDVMAANRLTEEPISVHTTNLRNGMSINVRAYQADGRDWVVLSASSAAEGLANEAPSDAVTAFNKSTDGWAFELSTSDFADFTYTKSAVDNGPIDTTP